MEQQESFDLDVALVSGSGAWPRANDGVRVWAVDGLPGGVGVEGVDI